VPTEKPQLPTLKIPRVVARRLRALARRSGKAQAEIVREGLAPRLGSEGPVGVLVLARAGDVVGSLEGPADLAMSPKHLRGFGR
jgi:hypothetical protein